MFANRTSSKYGEFEQALVQYVTIVAPFIRSLWSLEAAHANASDVYIFWLAIQATLTNLFSKGPALTGIQDALVGGVTAIVNKRYKEFFTHELYFVAFALDPRESSVPCITAYYHYKLIGFRVSKLRILQETNPEHELNDDHHYTSPASAHWASTVHATHISECS